MKTNFTAIFLMVLILTAQHNTQAQHPIQPQLFKISFDDDYFNYRLRGTDKYYTAGLEFSLYFKKGKPVPPQTERKQPGISNLYFISLKQIMNTPNEISKKGFQQGDYPYAGVLFATYGKIHSEKDSRFTNALSAGLLGPKAFAGETQTLVHRIIHYTKPAGWDSQISGELMVNFMATYEKAILADGNRLDVIGSTTLNAGTIFTNASAGLTVRAGRLKNYFENYEFANLADGGYSETAFYFYINPSITVVGYNASLQGEMINHPERISKNEYRIATENISRLLGRLAFGIKYEGKKMAASFSQVIQTAEFSTVKHHEYGNVSLSFRM